MLCKSSKRWREANRFSQIQLWKLQASKNYKHQLKVWRRNRLLILFRMMQHLRASCQLFRAFNSQSRILNRYNPIRMIQHQLHKCKDSIALLLNLSPKTSRTMQTRLLSSNIIISYNRFSLQINSITKNLLNNQCKTFTTTRSIITITNNLLKHSL